IAPLDGQTILLEDVPEPTSSEKVIGNGMAIAPVGGYVGSLVVGDVKLTFPTKHAMGQQTRGGIELLSHGRIHTEIVDREGYEIHLKQRDQVTIGDDLLTFNLDLDKRKAVNHITPVIATNGYILSSLKRTKDNTVVAGETTILELTLTENELKNGNEGGETEQEKSAQKRSKYSVEAAKIVAAVGGLDNINAATHCVTRLRFA